MRGDVEVVLFCMNYCSCVANVCSMGDGLWL